MSAPRFIEKIFAAGFFASAHHVQAAATFIPGNDKNVPLFANRILNLFNGREFDIPSAKALVDYLCPSAAHRKRPPRRGWGMNDPNGEDVDYSVVIPAYFSGEALLELIRRLKAVFRETLGATYEIILVNDGCFEPQHLDILSRCHSEHGAKIIHLGRNFGKPGALMAGFNDVSGRYVVTIDDDLQQRPEDIIKLAQLRDHDVVMAAYPTREHSALIRWTSLAKHQFDRVILGRNERMTPLKLMSRRVVDAIATMGGSRPYLPALLVGVTSDFVTVELEHQASAYAKSRYTLFKRISQFSGLIINTTSLPVRIVASIGGLIALISVILAFFFAIRKLAGVSPPTGWTSLMFAILFLGGTTLLTLGLIGEYLIRILEIVSEKRAFHVRSKVGFVPLLDRDDIPS